MPQEMAVEITIYLSESDKWHGRPLHVALLNFLREEKVFAATVFHAVGGFVGRQRVKSSHLVDAGGKLPIVLVFIDLEENVDRVLPKIKEMAPTHLILRESVTFEQGSLT
jgi:PII-like signaling protein